MKEFEKWLNKYHPRLDLEGFPCMTSTYKEGWRAALEWVLKQLDHSSEHKEIEDKIYGELG